MSEWKEYTGSDEQIAELRNAKYGWVAKFSDGSISGICDYNRIHILEKYKCNRYLICNPHPLADMINSQAMTGQPVWIKEILDDWSSGYRKDFIKLHESITTPDWKIPDAEYSFTPFD